jgi:hypothetical protein
VKLLVRIVGGALNVGEANIAFLLLGAYQCLVETLAQFVVLGLRLIRRFGTELASVGKVIDDTCLCTDSVDASARAPAKFDLGTVLGLRAGALACHIHELLLLTK